MAALKEMGYPCESHNEAQTLYGVGGHARSQKAHIIVRRADVGSAANDVGFLKCSNGKYSLIISEFDRRQTKQGTAFTKTINQLYGKYKVMKQVKRMGYSVTSVKTDTNGKLKIKVRAN